MTVAYFFNQISFVMRRGKEREKEREREGERERELEIEEEGGVAE
jgi:hypothetical protein